MANPVVVQCAADTWVKVATNVNTGIIHIVSRRPNVYFQTYRDTGEVAPTTLEGAISFKTPLLISSSIEIDVYIHARKKNGSVRVDL